MTTIRFFRDQGRLSGFVSEGHSGFAQAGEDIVCAAITSAIRLLECTVNDVLHAGAHVVAEEDAARISLTLPSPPDPAAEAQLHGFFLYMSELKKEYPKYLTVLEV